MWALVRLCVCVCARERISVHNRNETSGFKAPQKLISSEKQKWCEPPTAAPAAAEAERERAEVVDEADTRAADERRRQCVHNGAKAAQPPLNEIRCCCCCCYCFCGWRLQFFTRRTSCAPGRERARQRQQKRKRDQIILQLLLLLWRLLRERE